MAPRGPFVRSSREENFSVTLLHRLPFSDNVNFRNFHFQNQVSCLSVMSEKWGRLSHLHILINFLSFMFYWQGGGAVWHSEEVLKAGEAARRHLVYTGQQFPPFLDHLFHSVWLISRVAPKYRKSVTVSEWSRFDHSSEELEDFWAEEFWPATWGHN